MKITSRLNLIAVIVGLSSVLLVSFLLTHSSYAVSPDLLSDLRPVQSDLMNYDLVKDPTTGKILLRFGGAIGNYGDGPLEIVGYRTTVDLNNNVMPAFQRIYRADGTFHDEPAGLLIYHPEHHHFHYQSAMEYDLLDNNGLITKSEKQSFCLADVEIVDPTLPNFSKKPVYNRCYHDPRATFVREGMTVGWADVYDKSLVGQAFDVTDLMKLPQKTYTIKEITNPTGLLKETNPTPQSTSIDVVIGQGVKVGVGISRPGV